MPRGYSLHIGLNIADPAHYGDLPRLNAAVNDALFWEGFARKMGYQTRKLHDQEAKVATVKEILMDYARKMKAGDILLLTYAGHGGLLDNDKQAGLDKEPYDQTWCLFDRQMLDDEIHECFVPFREGTRIVVVSDSCHSGTITRKVQEGIDLSDLLEEGSLQLAAARGMTPRIMPVQVAYWVSQKFRDSVYKPLLAKYRFRRKGTDVKASVTLLAACQDHQITYDGAENGIFTAALKKLMQNRKYQRLNAEGLVKSVSLFYSNPLPNYFHYGSIIPTAQQNNPFLINIPKAGIVEGYKVPHLPDPQGPGFFPYNPAGLDNGSVQAKSAILRIEIPGFVNPDTIKAGKDIKILRHETEGESQIWEIELPQVPMDNAWNAAHTLQAGLLKSYPNTQVVPLLSLNLAPSEKAGTREADRNRPEYIDEWPPETVNSKVAIGWHLDDAHSQLAKARQAVLEKADASTAVRIAHLDTGYLSKHPALPEKLNRSLGCSFVSGEENNMGTDDNDGVGQDGHGTGTLVLLGGSKLDYSQTFGEFEGYVGGAPFAEIIPMRISESVVIWNSDNFCRAIQRAIDLNCEVVSMSMAGKPSPRMARMVDKAYEAGIVIVSAASNCWYKGVGALLPKCVLFPAAFPRVVGATGAMFNHQPYDHKFIRQGRFKITTKYMQGSWGPPSRMRKALAAYTPNVPWASDRLPILRSGGGTSSATPQIAAAAALWIGYHRKKLEEMGYYQTGNQWMKVEAVRHALYSSAAKDTVFPEWKKYYGNGILRAYDALQIPPLQPAALKKAPESKVSLGGLLDIAASLFLNRSLSRDSGPKPSSDALAMELLHLLQTDPALRTDFQSLDLGNAKGVEKRLRSEVFKKKISASNMASPFLKEYFI
jgi:subtilisin family serine protease